MSASQIMDKEEYIKFKQNNQYIEDGYWTFILISLCNLQPILKYTGNVLCYMDHSEGVNRNSKGLTYLQNAMNSMTLSTFAK